MKEIDAEDERKLNRTTIDMRNKVTLCGRSLSAKSTMSYYLYCIRNPFVAVFFTDIYQTSVSNMMPFLRSTHITVENIVLHIQYLQLTLSMLLLYVCVDQIRYKKIDDKSVSIYLSIFKNDD